MIKIYSEKDQYINKARSILCDMIFSNYDWDADNQKPIGPWTIEGPNYSTVKPLYGKYFKFSIGLNEINEKNQKVWLVGVCKMYHKGVIAIDFSRLIY